MLYNVILQWVLYVDGDKCPAPYCAFEGTQRMVNTASLYRAIKIVLRILLIVLDGNILILRSG